MNLTDEFDIEALWTIDYGKNDQKIIGTLTFARDQITLELPNVDLDIDQTFNIVIGETQTKIISLFNLKVFRNYDKNLRHTKLIAKYMIVDVKPIEKIENFKLESVNFSFNLLPLLLNKNLWKKDREIKALIKEPVESKKYEINFLDALLTEKYRWTDRSEITPKNGMIITLSTHSYFELKYSEKKNILKVKQDIIKIRNLLSIIIGEALTISYVSYESKTIDLAGKIMPFYGQFYFSQADVTRREKQITAAYNYNDITKSLSEILNKYFEDYQKLKPLIQNLYIHTSMMSLLETQFHDAITSLEVYHREYYYEYEEISDDLEHIKQEILNYIESNHENDNEKKELMRTIKYSNRVTLKNRVKQLLIDLPIELKERIQFKEINFTSNTQVDDFAYQCAHTRNYHAHGITEPKENVIENNDLFYVTRILNLVSEYYLMKQIGVSDEGILKGIRNKKRYQLVLKNINQK